VYLVEAKCQMSELRKLYMKETNWKEVLIW
jgi:hypothetical protein